MNQNIKNVLLVLVLVVSAVLLWNWINQSRAATKEIPFSEFLDRVAERQVTEVLIRGNDVYGRGPSTAPAKPLGAAPWEFYTYAPDYDQLVTVLREAKVSIKAAEPSQGFLGPFLIYWLPILVLIAVWFFFYRQMQAGGNKAMAFGKSRARMLNPQQKRVTFKDVAGVEEAKEELGEIIEFLRDPQKFQKLGGKIPKGVLLMGPPGTGKTLLARAVAGEAEVPFFSISGSDFVEMFVGVGASRVRDLFEQGKKNAPCIIFIDEIDAVGRHRGAGLGGGHDEREQTLNALLVEMDGFESNEGVILVAATNRPDVLDPALLRPGRFDRRIVVNRPDLNGRIEILKVHTSKITLAPDVELSVLARSTPGFSGADIANLVNEAALRAARLNKSAVEMADFEFAKDKVMMGAERRSLALSEEEKRVVAYHEAGHALVAAVLPNADPLHKVTIIPRGLALGLTQQLPEEDRYLHARAYLEDELVVLMGGRLAEQVVFGDSRITTGAGSDLERATELARKMVCEWGMSALGPLTFGKREEAIFLGKEFARHQDYSEATAVEIDSEIKRLVQTGYQRAHEIMTAHRAVLDRIADALLEREVLEGEEVYRMVSESTGVPVEELKGPGRPSPSPEVL
ncbi:MAG TPA: ATP-dependent zinc metalloprotease FtsH [Thermoanaerobaculaceae bacterium]|nr:ATP-dependent zinc metalloprotease FtsH [Thermoanaerobaculaceae bacterium]HRS16238.1 ATP-dependent zinc metalloprotease FtsH [Thermoanaerobaculaceae bacterium]